MREYCWTAQCDSAHITLPEDVTVHSLPNQHVCEPADPAPWHPVSLWLRRPKAMPCAQNFFSSKRNCKAEGYCAVCAQYVAVSCCPSSKQIDHRCQRASIAKCLNQRPDDEARNLPSPTAPTSLQSLLVYEPLNNPAPHVSRLTFQVEVQKKESPQKMTAFGNSHSLQQADRKTCATQQSSRF